MNIILIICSLFLLFVLLEVIKLYKDNPYLGSKFYIDSDKGDNSALYISTVTTVDGFGNPIPKFKRVSCAPGNTYTAAVGSWFYNVFEHNSEKSKLLNLIPITEERATEIYKLHRLYTKSLFMD